MFSIEKSAVPANTMLNQYLVSGAYTDCYLTEIRGQVSFADFIFAFYTTPLFKLERLILKLAVSKPSLDAEARQLADGASNKFAAWQVAGRNENELLMCDILERTCSWFMVLPMGETRTRLYFGSAISSRQDPKTGKLSLGLVFQALLRFHQIYSVLLLYSAKLRIKNQFAKGSLLLKKENS